MSTGADLIPLPGSEPLTMSSREIAELVEKRHDHVMRDIKKMLEELGEPSPKFGGTSTVQQPNGGEREVPCFHLPKDLTLTLVAGYNVVLRKRIIDRWLELESAERAAPPQINLNDPAQLRSLLLTYSEKQEALERRVAELLPSEQALNRLAKADGSLCITDAAKALQMRPKDLFNWLRENGWIYKRPGSAYHLGYHSKIAAGLLEHKITTVHRSDGSEKVTEQVRITPKGLAKLAQIIKPPAALL